MPTASKESGPLASLIAALLSALVSIEPSTTLWETSDGRAGCLATWCPCMLYQKNHDLARGDPEPSGFGGQVRKSASLKFLPLPSI